MNRIMDTEINDLDTPLYLQNGKAYLEIYFDIFKEQFPNLNALQEGEKHTFSVIYKLVCYVVHVCIVRS